MNPKTARLLRMLLLAVIGAVMLAWASTGHAQEEECPDDDCSFFAYQPPYPTNICDMVTPYGYWYYFFDCHNRNLEAMETESTATIDNGDGTLTIQIHRRYVDGRAVAIERTVRRPQR